MNSHHCDKKKLLDYLKGLLEITDDSGIIRNTCVTPKCVVLNLKQRLEYGDFDVKEQILQIMFTPVMVRPGSCIADIADVKLKIKAREERIVHLEHEKLCIEDKIDVMKHEIKEFREMETR